jgi:hypothetical protein
MIVLKLTQLLPDGDCATIRVNSEQGWIKYEPASPKGSSMILANGQEIFVSETAERIDELLEKE